MTEEVQHHRFTTVKEFDREIGVLESGIHYRKKTIEELEIVRQRERDLLCRNNRRSNNDNLKSKRREKIDSLTSQIEKNLVDILGKTAIQTELRDAKKKFVRNHQAPNQQGQAIPSPAIIDPTPMKTTRMPMTFGSAFLTDELIKADEANDPLTRLARAQAKTFEQDKLDAKAELEREGQKQARLGLLVESNKEVALAITLALRASTEREHALSMDRKDCSANFTKYIGSPEFQEALKIATTPRKRACDQ